MAYRLSPQMLKEIGLRIKRARKAQKRRAIDVALQSGVEPSYYTKLENGKAKRPSLQKIYAVCRTLNLNSKDILTF